MQSQICKHQWAKREQFRGRTRSIGYRQLQGSKKLTSTKAKRRFGICKVNVNIGDNSGLCLASHESRDASLQPMGTCGGNLSLAVRISALGHEPTSTN
jgi:hypothetical protein